MADQPEPRARIIEIGGQSRALGEFVSLELATPFTVLVGRNAAGKSAVLHLIEHFARHAVSAVPPDRNPSLADEFRCTIEIDARRYLYTADILEVRTAEGDLEILWSERCWDQSADKELWSVRSGIGTALATKFLVPSSTGLLALDPNHLPEGVTTVAAALGRLFRHVMLVPAGLPAADARTPIVFDLEPKMGTLRGSSGSPRVDRFALQLMRWAQTENESFGRVGDVLRRIGVCEKLALFTIDAWGWLVVDDIDLDDASDGTLRVIEIVVALELAAAGALVMIEEPETGIHPGLCDAIMAEIEAAAEGLQLIISTHSPRILDGVQYHQLRHVRRNGSTRIAALTPEQVKEVKAFLDHQGMLSDYVFSRDFADADAGEPD